MVTVNTTTKNIVTVDKCQDIRDTLLNKQQLIPKYGVLLTPKYGKRSVI